MLMMRVLNARKHKESDKPHFGSGKTQTRKGNRQRAKGHRQRTPAIIVETSQPEMGQANKRAEGHENENGSQLGIIKAKECFYGGYARSPSGETKAGKKEKEVRKARLPVL